MDELITALKLIKNTCTEHKSCVNCPLRLGGGDSCCITSFSPNKWELVVDKENFEPSVFIH